MPAIINLPIPIYGDMKWRGKCPKEDMEQISFMNRLRKEHPNTYGRLAVHIKNEGRVTKGQFSAMTRHHAMGLVAGAPDIVIPGRQTLLIEMKRQDRTKSDIAQEQIDYLTTAHGLGAFACVALGAEAAWQAFGDWLSASGEKW